MPVGTPNSRDVVFIQRGGTGNNFYEEVHISGSNLIFYTDPAGRMTADKTSSFFASITNQSSASWASQSFLSNYSISSSWASQSLSASWAPSTPSNTSISASWASSSISSSYSSFSVTSSFALNFNPSATASYAVSSSNAVNAITASYVTGSEVFVDKLSSPHIRFGHKRISILSSSYVNGLTISLDDFQSVYVKTTIHGSWSGSAPVGYISEYFLQKGTLSDTETQPGVILREDNNNKGARRILSQIVDPGAVSGPADFVIQYTVEGSFDFNNAILTYEVRGEINSIL